ncbi:MAG: hypothetical protein ACREA4_06430, partial [Nitrososphaera sp.]
MDRWSANRYFTYALLLTLVGSIFSSLVTFQPSYASHNIILDDIDDEYDAGDKVSISGNIDNVNDNENEVTIRIEGPKDKTEQVTLDGDDFQWDYNIPSDAGDGIYSVEVEYDSESVFTYFFIDDNNDLRVVADQDTYDLGDRVELQGEVNDPQLDVDNVEITVYDPNGGTLLDEEAFELDGNRFSDDFGLGDNDDDHGTYAVLVFYNNDDNEEGYLIFEVKEDSGSSSGDFVSAELSKTSYKRGEQV